MLIRRFVASVMFLGALSVLPGCSNAPDSDTANQNAVPLVTPEVKVASSDPGNTEPGSSSRPDSTGNETSPFEDGNPFLLPEPGPEQPPGTEVATADTPKFSEPLPSADGPAPLLVPPEPKSLKKGVWLTKFDEAKTLAAAEGKDILLDFTGSDWCTYCIALDREVFSDPDFAAYAAKNLVLVELDFPKFKRQSSEQREHNEDLNARFKVEGFPTLIMTDQQGRLIGRLGYQPGGFPEFLTMFESVRETRVARDAALDAAKTLTGVERAKKLDEALKAVGSGQQIDDYRSEIEEIARLDADNAGGVGKYWQDKLSFEKLLTRVREIESMINSRETPTVEQMMAEFDKAKAEFADFRRGVVEIELFRVQVLEFLEKPTVAMQVLDGLLKDKQETEPAVRFRIYATAAQMLLSSDKSSEALPIIDAGIEELAGNAEEQINLLLTKARVLDDLGRKDEAHAQFAAARKVADPELLDQLESIEIRLLGRSTAEPDKKPE